MSCPYSQALRPPSCRLKNHYPEYEMAEKARDRTQQKWGWLLRIYHCNLCGEFHFARVKRRGRAVPYIEVRK